MHSFFEIFIFTPNFFKHSIALSTSSDLNKFLALDIPIACDVSKSHLIDILLSPSTSIVF